MFKELLLFINRYIKIIISWFQNRVLQGSPISEFYNIRQLDSVWYYFYEYEV